MDQWAVPSKREDRPPKRMPNLQYFNSLCSLLHPMQIETSLITLPSGPDLHRVHPACALPTPSHERLANDNFKLLASEVARRRYCNK